MNQPAEETEMDVNEQHEAENGRRMVAACDNDFVVTRKAALARASRPSRRVVVMFPVD